MKRIDVLGPNPIHLEVDDGPAELLKRHVIQSGFAGVLQVAMSPDPVGGEWEAYNLATAYSIHIREVHPQGELVPASRAFAVWPPGGAPPALVGPSAKKLDAGPRQAALQLSQEPVEEPPKGGGQPEPSEAAGAPPSKPRQQRKRT
jgi:hypothetical protein